MVSSKAATVADYLVELPADRRAERAERAEIERVREVIRDEIASTTPDEFIRIYENARTSGTC